MNVLAVALLALSALLTPASGLSLQPTPVSSSAVDLGDHLAGSSGWPVPHIPVVELGSGEGCWQAPASSSSPAITIKVCGDWADRPISV